MYYNLFSNMPILFIWLSCCYNRKHIPDSDKIGLLGLLVEKHILFAHSSISVCSITSQGGESWSCEMQTMDVR